MKKIGVGIILFLFLFSCKKRNELLTTMEIHDPLADTSGALYQLAIKVFSYDNPYEINVQTGDYFFLIEDDFSVIEKNLIKEINIYDSGGFCKQRVYSNGLIEKNYSIYNEGIYNNTYFYERDNDNKIIGNSNWVFVYADNFDTGKLFYKRIVYLASDLVRTETICLTERGYKIILEHSGEFRQERHFNFVNDLLVEIIDYTKEGSVWERFIIEYESNNLIKKISCFIGNDISVMENVIKRNGLCIAELEKTFYDKEGKTIVRYIFENHDQFNNWTIRKSFIGNELEEEIHRDIKY